ncbi:MAG: hypothetical protein ACLTE2_09265 [Eubacteriales bacterium]
MEPAATQTPLVAKMAMEEHIMASNILFASTRSLGDKAYGKYVTGNFRERNKWKKLVILRRIPDIPCKKR